MFGESKLNLVLVVGAVLVILVGWQFLMPVFFPTPPAPPPREVTAEQQRTGVDATGQQLPTASAAGEDSAAMPVLERQAAIRASDRILIDGTRVRGSILLKGARFDDVVLRDYRQHREADSPNIFVFSPRNADHPYFAELGWIQDSGTGLTLPDSDTVWQADRGTLNSGSSVTLSWDNGEGLLFTRKITLDEDFLFTTVQSVTNSSEATVRLYPYGFIAHYDTPASGMTGMFAVNSEEFVPWGMFAHGGVGVLQGAKQEFSYEDMQDSGKTEIQSDDGWVGITGKYWLSALIPDPKQAITADFAHSSPNQRDLYQVDYRWQNPVVIQPRETQKVSNHLFVGAKEFNLLDSYEGSLGVRDLDSAVDFGLVWFLARPLFYPIDFFYRNIGNFGVAILLLTICVRIVLYPLANKAYSSMSKMRKLQPDTIMLRERYKDDKAKMNMEMMALYRREKANPMAGCLPMLVQIPVFFALYSVLFATIEMRHAPFFGWIQDLSAPDPMTFITGFGLVDWPAPEFLMIGIWPILFAATMLLQMKLNPQPVEPLQQKIMMFLPLLFLFMFARFPAGLVVYWTWNNVLSIAQQWLIMQRMGITRASLQADAARIKKIKEQAAAGTLPMPSRSRPSTGRKKKRPTGERSERTNRSERSERSSTAAPRGRSAEPAKRKKSYREQAEELRREKIRQRKRKIQAAEAKKRAKKRGDTNEKSTAASDTATDKENKLSRRERRAAKADTQGSDVKATSGTRNKTSGTRQEKSESDTWQEDKKPPSRRAKGKKPAPRR
ncbi:MAG: membrane protein insertase YidC [Proteobacteria bacterium]|nr:membrane protein insertase YidC [Pseudomonadota bacterium]